MADFGETGKICEKNFVSFIKLRISSLTGAQSEFLKITPTIVHLYRALRAKVMSNKVRPESRI